MSWKIRHEGSPRTVEGLTQAQVLEGLRDGLWEPTDEVMGPNDRTWVALESHPAFEEICLDLEPPPPRVHDDETRLDMNPLIDVALVLLIFFILTTTYTAMAKMLDMPPVASAEAGIPVKEAGEVREATILVQAMLQNGRPVIKVEEQEVPEEQLVERLAEVVRQTGKREVAILADKDVPWRIVLMIQDRAKGAGIQQAYHLVMLPQQPK